ncbi:MAG: hypothetical protein HC789_02165 [Microcoleus sp. CSU_2_2]|nr:hypothetical protein [Microcoleus sp. SU_5_3]NJS09256.1 hypothetical protein [Microcoleus sp. CSU_2_2]
MIIVQVTKCGWLSEDITLYLLLPILAIEGLLVGWGEAEPLDLRYQALPGNEGICDRESQIDLVTGGAIPNAIAEFHGLFDGFRRVGGLVRVQKPGFLRKYCV